MTPAGAAPFRLTRRELLRTGLCGSLALSAAGWWTAPAAAAQTAVYGTLSAEGATILRAIAPAILDGCLPADAAQRERLLDDMLAAIDRYLSHLSPSVQKEALDGFGLLHFPPFRALVAGVWSRWPGATPEETTNFLRGFRDSRFQLFRSLYAFLQSVVVLGWFDLPAAWAYIGYDGPASPDEAAA